jgi:hypothetical protein
MTRAHNVHVLPDFDAGWYVVQGGRTLSRHGTQKEALEAGRRVARRSAVDLLTWSSNGQIRSKDSYGNESAAPDREH